MSIIFSVNSFNREYIYNKNKLNNKTIVVQCNKCYKIIAFILYGLLGFLVQRLKIEVRWKCSVIVSQLLLARGRWINQNESD